MTDGASEEMHLCLALGGYEVLVGEWTGVGVKSLAHELDADFGIRIAGTYGVGGLPDRDFDLLEGLEHRNVVVTAPKQRYDFLGE